MNRQRTFLVCWAAAAVTALPLMVFASAFTSGNMVVVRTGNDVYASDTSAAPVYLDEYDYYGNLVQSVPMGDYANTVDPQFTLDGGNGNTGFISRSYNGQYLVMGGYKAPLGTPGVTGTAAARTIARIDLSGNIDTSTTLTDIGTNEIRFVASKDGNQFWSGGTGNSNQCRYTTLGASTSTRVPTSTGYNAKSLNIFTDAVGEPQLYMSRGSNANCVNTITHAIDPEPKLPTTTHTSTDPVVVAALVNEAGASTYDFLLMDGNTLYRTDDNSNEFGGIAKYTFDGTAWTKQYVLQAGLSYVPLRGLTGGRDEYNNVVLFATDGNGQNLVRVTDRGPGSTFTTIATATGNMVFHDVVLPYSMVVPEPASLFLLSLGGALCLRRRHRA